MDPVVAERMREELVGNRIGDWTPDRFLGNGKSALVLRAHRNEQVAALKIFDPDLVKRYGEAVQLNRIDRERLLIGLHHPNLVQIYDGGKCPNTNHLFVAMEYIDAPDLEAALAEVPRDRIRPLVAQLANAARFLEGLNLVHRDIKPANMAVSANFQTLTLLDLGVIRPLGDGTLTDNERRAFVGTHQYSPPEFMNRREQDTLDGWRAVTFYQIGAVLHDLLTRKPLFHDFISPQATLIHAVESEIPQIDGGGLDPDLILLAKNCLVKDPILRLRLVNWDSFAAAPAPTSVASLRDRARRTLAMGSGEPVTEDPANTASQVRLHEIVSLVQGMIRKECFGNMDLFPAVEVHDHSTGSQEVAEFRAAFPKSAKCKLPNALALTLRIQLLDTASQIVQLDARASVGGCVGAFEGETSQLCTSVFSGAFEEATVRGIVQTILYQALEACASVPTLDHLSVRALPIKTQTSSE
jgi:serine/threonine protein kinase